MELGIPELVVILLMVLLLFGPSRLPQAGAGLGKAIRGFRDAMAGRGEDKDEKEAKDEAEDGTRPKSEVRAALPPGARPSGG